MEGSTSQDNCDRVLDSAGQKHMVPVLEVPASLSDRTNVVVLDWDNTLFPSTYFLSQLDCSVDERCSRVKSFMFKEPRNREKYGEFIGNLESVGRCTLNLLRKLLVLSESRRVTIVTNAVVGWVMDSLAMAGSFHKVWSKVKRLLVRRKIEIMYAREGQQADNSTAGHTLWKARCYQTILSDCEVSREQKVNVITIGDQWHDHSCVKRCEYYKRCADNLSHHQFKLMDCPSCDYLCAELKYITKLMEPKLIANFESDGVIMEFDG